MSQLENTIRRASAIKGIFLGLILLAFSILSYYLLIYIINGNALLVTLSQVVFFVIIRLAAAIFFSFSLRKSIGGYWNFKQAVTGVFIMLTVSFIITSVGKDLVFAKFIEPDMANKTEAAMMNTTTMELRKLGATQTAIDQKKAEIRKQLDGEKSTTIGAIIEAYVITLILLFALALAFAALLKRDPPQYQTSGDITQ